MSDPQKSKAFISIPTSFYDNLCKIRIPGQARQVLDFIIRKTLGWHKTQDYITLKELSTGTGLHKIPILKSIKILEVINILNVTQKGKITQMGNANLYKLILNSKLWHPLPKRVALPKRVMTITHMGNGTIFNKEYIKETPKDSKLQGAQSKLYSRSDISRYNVNFLELWEIYPRKTHKYISAQAYHALNPNKDLRKKILASIHAHINSDLWTKIRYIPSLLSFLNSKLYEDDVPPKEEPPTPAGTRYRTAKETDEYLKEKGLLP